MKAQIYRLGLCVFYGVEDGAAPIPVLCVGIGAILQEKLENLSPVVVHGDVVKSGEARDIRKVYRRSVRDEELENLCVLG